MQSAWGDSLREMVVPWGVEMFVLRKY